MKILYQKGFLKNYKKRISPNEKLNKAFKKRVELYLKDQQHPLLKDHKLLGTKRGYRSFSVTGDVRVIYRNKKNNVIFCDIGTHNQVYT